MAQTIGDFKGGFNGGTRANRFIVNINWPADIDPVPEKLDYHAIATKLPSSELGLIQVPYRGRIAYYAGDRDYKPWTVTILDDTGVNSSWKAFQTWSELLSSHTLNTSSDENFAVDNLLKTIEVTQLHTPNGSKSTDVEFDIHRKIILNNAWPMSVKGIRFDMANGGELVRYDVEFSYDYYVIETGL
jgi:hypothetical protein